jgi:[ribosomal protein S5]-alanine N-acetyltransferase
VPAATRVHRPALSDEQAFVTAIRDSRDLHAPWIEPPDSHVRYAQYLNRISQPEHAGFLVIDQAGGGLVGFININEIVPERLSRSQASRTASSASLSELSIR